MKNNKRHNQKEVRVRVAPQRFEVRSNADGSRSISGYAASFNDLSQDLGGFKEAERVRPLSPWGSQMTAPLLLYRVPRLVDYSPVSQPV
jgi:hypothetical protein